MVQVVQLVWYSLFEGCSYSHGSPQVICVWCSLFEGCLYSLYSLYSHGSAQVICVCFVPCVVVHVVVVVVQVIWTCFGPFVLVFVSSLDSFEVGPGITVV